MKTMNVRQVIDWVGAKHEHKLAGIITDFGEGMEVMDKPGLEAVFHLALGEERGPDLFREMECEVVTILNLELS